MDRLDYYDRQQLLTRAMERTPEGRYLSFEMLMCDFGRWSRTGSGLPSYRHAGMEAANGAVYTGLSDAQGSFIDKMVTKAKQKAPEECVLAFKLLYMTSSSDISTIKRLNRTLNERMVSVPLSRLQTEKGAYGQEFVDMVRHELISELGEEKAQ